MTDHANYRARLGTLRTGRRTQPPTVPTHHGSRATAYSIQSRYEPWAGHWVGRTVAGHSSDCDSTALGARRPCGGGMCAGLSSNATLPCGEPHPLGWVAKESRVVRVAH